MFGLKEKDISIINSIFSKYTEITKVIIFGSRVKGTYTDRSDIDIVILDEIDNIIFSNIINDFDESDLIYKVDLKCISDISNEALLDHIHRLGKVIYQK